LAFVCALADKPKLLVFLYDCTIAKKPSRLQWVSDTLAFVVPGDGKILVIDAITLYFKLSPMTVKVSRNTDT
jgi:hypothetical protein